MAASYAEWKHQVAELDALISKIGASILIIRELEGVRELEEKLLLNPSRNGEVDPALEDYIDQLSIKLFGITKEDTQFKYPSNFENLIEGTNAWWVVQSRGNEYEQQFSTYYMTDDEAALALLVMGIDFRDDRGDPLRCTKLLCRQVEGAFRKVMGNLPNAEDLSLKTWETRLEKDAKLHLSRKGKR